MSDRPATTQTPVLIVVRYVLPTVVVLAGVIALVISPTERMLEGVAGIVGAGLAIGLLNWLHRMGVDGDSARDDEIDARRYFDEHGHWPDEAPTATANAPLSSRSS